MHYKAPKKSLGQNFLTSIPARIAIVEAGKVTETDTVLEIGPGRGFLTRGLLDKGAKVIALEKDTDLIPVLNETFAKEKETKKFALIEGDALTYEPEHKHYKLIANIPYYITGAILSHYLSMENKPGTMVVLVQKEVAQRVVAQNGKESILSIAVKAYGTPRLVYKVNKGSFNPIPKVDSAVLAIEDISNKNFAHKESEELFFSIVKAGFAHKRKFLISNLKEKLPELAWAERFKNLALDEKIRAEDLTLTDWLSLANTK